MSGPPFVHHIDARLARRCQDLVLGGDGPDGQAWRPGPGAEGDHALAGGLHGQRRGADRASAGSAGYCAASARARGWCPPRGPTSRSRARGDRGARAVAGRWPVAPARRSRCVRPAAAWRRTLAVVGALRVAPAGVAVTWTTSSAGAADLERHDIQGARLPDHKQAPGDRGIERAAERDTGHHSRG